MPKTLGEASSHMSYVPVRLERLRTSMPVAITEEASGDDIVGLVFSTIPAGH